MSLCARSPSEVRITRPSLSLSRRPAQKRRSFAHSRGSRAKMVWSACGSLLLLTKPGSQKETRHMAVDIAGSGLTYKVGDSLGVFPSNRPGEVDEILARLGATGNELVSPVMLKLPAPIPVREALAGRLALAKPT